MTMTISRRALLPLGFALTPLAALLVAGCADDGGPWPEGMLPIKWDRDACLRCKMAISDRRFAVQVRGGPRAEAFKFDDIGCAVSWCHDKRKDHPWTADAATRWWVAESRSDGHQWLDARRAQFIAGPRSPMGYDLLAVAAEQPGSVDFDTMARKVVETWPVGCSPAESARRAAAAGSAA